MDSRTPGPHHHLKNLQKGTSYPDLCGVCLCLPNCRGCSNLISSACLRHGIPGKSHSDLLHPFQWHHDNSHHKLVSASTAKPTQISFGVSDRFVASKDASLNACYLTISEVQAAGEATYYCLSSTGSEYHCATHYGVMKTKPYALGNSFTTAIKRRPAGWWIQLKV
ncbi:hypothetical protein L345_16411, partial [Ophiophagus hannah]